MKKMLSIAAVAALATSSFAASDLAGAFKEGKTSGQVRAMYIKTDVKDPKDPAVDTSAFALGGKLAYETAPLYGISAGAAFYTTNDMGSKNNDGNKVDGTLYDENSKSYSLLGQAYVVGSFGKTTVKVGRQQIDTPLAGSDDIRMVPNLFEAALVINTDLPSTTLIGGYVARMAGWDSVSDKASKSQFQSMSRSALAGNTALGSLADASLAHDAVGDKGVYVIAAVNNSIKDLTLQLWEYYAVDVVNAVYLQADYKLGLGKDTALNIAAQYYNIQGIGRTKDLLKDTGDNTAGYYAALTGAGLNDLGKIDYNVYGVKASLETAIGLTPYLAYNKVSEQNDRNGGTFVFGAWGGYPEFAMSEEFWYNSGTNMNGGQSYKVGADYSLEKLGLGARTLGVAYTKFDAKDKYNGNTDADTSVVDVIYTCAGALVKNLDAKIAFSSIDKKDSANDSTKLKVIFNYNF